MRIVFSVAILLLCSQIKAQQFLDITNDAGIFHVPIHQNLMGGGLTWFDYNNDDQTDLFFSGCRTRDILFKNNGDGTFSDVTTSAGLDLTDAFNTMGVVHGDINNDGYDDLFITVWDEASTNILSRNILFLNNGDGTFSDISVTAGMTEEFWSTSAAMLDVNLDGYLDIYVLNYMLEPGFILDDDGATIGFDHTCFDNFLYINNGDLTFTESAENYGVLSGACGLALSTSDVDKDGDPDIQIANDFGEFITPNQLFINNYPLPTFTNAAEESGFDIGLYGMGVAVGDIDNDLDQDFYITNMGRNSLLVKNDDDLSFTDIADPSGTDNTGNGSLLYTSWGDLFLDIDNDTYLDLFVANGHMSAASFIQNVQDDPDKLFLNNGDLTFEDISETGGVDYRGICRGTAYGDLDKDGALDIAVSGIENPFFTIYEGVKLYQNQNTTGNWIGFTLEGVTTNRNAFGSSITLYAEGQSFYRELLGGSSHLSQNESILHFGLDEIAEVDSLTVLWTGGSSQTIYDLEINEYHHILQEVSDYVEESNPNSSPLIFPNPLSKNLALSVNTKEGPGLLEIYSNSGQLVFSTNLDHHLNQIILDLSSGTYIAKLTTEQNSWVSKLHIID